MELKIKDLKSKIEKKSIDDSFLVLLYPDNTFLANQYVDGVAQARNREKVFIDDLSMIKKTSNVFDLPENNLYILNVDKFDSKVDNFYPYKNVVVVCNQISESTKQIVIDTGIYSVLPKLQDWQVIEYMKSKCSGLTESQVRWLYDVSKGDVYRINSEISKLSIFEHELQSELFKKTDAEGGYNDLNSSTIFNFTNAILKKDIRTLSSIMTQIDSIDVEPMGLIAVLYKNLRNIIDVKLNPKATYESLGMSDKQFKAISYNYNNLSSDQVINMFEFITSIDLKIKSGLLQLQDSRLIDYVVSNMLSK